MNKFTSSKKKTVFGVVTDQILQAFSEGQIPWSNRFRINGFPHMNLLSKRPYNGINRLTTMCRGFNSPFWVSKLQAKNLGMKRRKDEKYTAIIYYNVFEDKNDPDRKIPFARYSQCFNVEQMEEIPECVVPTIPEKIEENLSAEKLIQKMKNIPEIKVGAKSIYSNEKDVIFMKNQSLYKNPNDYYRDLFKQLTLSTVHKTRLGKSIKPSEIELVAELGSAFLCSECNIEFKVQDSAKYITYWMDKLTKNERLVINASKRAHDAIEWLLQKHYEEAEQDYKKLLIDEKLRSL